MTRGNNLFAPKIIYAALAIFSTISVVSLVALRRIHSQLQIEKIKDQNNIERIKLLEEQIDRLESRNASEARQQFKEKIDKIVLRNAEENRLIKEHEQKRLTQQQTTRRQPVPQGQGASGGDLSEYDKQIRLNRDLAKNSQRFSNEFSSYGLMDGAKNSVNDMARYLAIAECLERYKNASEPYYKAKTACQSEAANTRTPF